MQRLTRELAKEFQRQDIASVLALPVSTVYRWTERSTACRSVDHGELERAVAECRASGFDVGAAVRKLTGRGSVRATHDDASGAAYACGGGDSAAPAFEPRRDVQVGDARMLAARAKIEREFYSSLSCGAMASAAGLSRFHFIKLFKSCFGVSPYHALLSTRLRHAKILLRTTLQPVSDIAIAVGFGTESALRRAFSSIEGRSLSAFCANRTSTTHVALPAAAPEEDNAS